MTICLFEATVRRAQALVPLIRRHFPDAQLELVKDGRGRTYRPNAGKAGKG